VLLLALDSAEAACSVALWDLDRPEGEALLGHRALAPARGQADRLIELIDDLLAVAGVPYGALALLAVNHGPGSFTGLRSAVAAGRGLALATGLPVLAIGSLEALAAAVPAGAGVLLAALDARRGQVYAQPFAPDLTPLSPPRVVAPEAAVAEFRGHPLRLVGSGARLIAATLPADVEAMIEPAELDARAVAACAALRLAQGRRPTVGTALKPLYLRPPDARPQVPLVAAVGEA
jgi:tRNA threonylcarbamoyladenosine biosynthesis protein TsaB